MAAGYWNFTRIWLILMELVMLVATSFEYCGVTSNMAQNSGQCNQGSAELGLANVDLVFAYADREQAKKGAPVLIQLIWASILSWLESS